MAFEQGVPTSQEDFVSKLGTFITANGWTQDDFDATENEATYHRGDCYITLVWDGTETGQNQSIGLYQSLGYTGGNDPDDHPDDSGNGPPNQDYSIGRSIRRIGGGPYTGYTFFAQGDVVFAVLEYSPGLYRHLWFGTIDKIGDWTGGEFVAGHVWRGFPSTIDDPKSSRHSLGLDHRASSGTDDDISGATMHVEGLPGLDGASKWGVFRNATDDDSAGNDRVELLGGVRGGNHLDLLGALPANTINGFVPMIPVPVWYRNTAPSPDHAYYLGKVPDVRMVQMQFFEPGDEIVVGSDTWKIFPGVRKRFEQDDQEETRDMGIAYRKVT